jgi:hypothetical protein
MRKLIAMIAAAVAASATLPAATINLANVTGYTTLHDGDVVTGTLGGNYKIDITDGATVTLRDVTINSTGNLSTLWAGITCNGNATIILEGANTVKGFSDYAAGISVAYTKTLTIQGTGSLTAIGCTSAAGIGAGPFNCGNIIINGGTITATGGRNGAGIGGGDRLTCGDITINGGTIVATGGSCAAGIGSGDTGSSDLSCSCGNIAINGGNVTANGGLNAAGIGCGRGSGCDSIYIGSDITRVVAVKVSEGAQHIGLSTGDLSYCGAITVDASLTDVTSDDGMTRTISHDAPPPSPWNGNLATLTDSVTVTNGYTVTGELAGNYKVTIADGATVTLSGATINGVNSESYKWAGITCLGDATIVLEGENRVTGFHEDYPGIYVPPHKTLTIKGSGSLSASSCPGSYSVAAGIGGGYQLNCGTIVIEGGEIFAEGSDGGAGIGSGNYGACDGVTILGGTVTADGGGNSAGIGAGSRGTCGDIAILGGSVTATAYSHAAGIGGGYSSTCGNIDIGPDVILVVATHGGGDDWENPEPIGAGEDGTASNVNVADGLSYKKVDRTLTLKTGNLAYVTEDTVFSGPSVLLTGELAGNYKITLDEGALATISNVVINGVNDESCRWAGITCLAGSRITIKGKNTITGFHEDYPGISYVTDAPQSLIFTGDGKLTVSSNGSAAGIGGGPNENCGKLWIWGGNITATGGAGAAGIGSASGGYCAAIDIDTATVTAIGGGGAAGIGGGSGGGCGIVYIEPDVVRVVATCGEGCQNPIGAGDCGSSVDVEVSPDVLRDVTTGSTRTIEGGRIIHLDDIPRSMLAGNNLIVMDGRILTGQLVGDYKISIWDGATVTLCGAIIERIGDDELSWAGITCRGSATIVLKGDNYVAGFGEGYPGIYVPPRKTLTIMGDGSLEATAGGEDAAGIGASSSDKCGNIVIEGGTITARGDHFAAGIGGTGQECGVITINGGNITAIGGEGAAGIGGGLGGVCRGVSIGSGIERVEATAGYDCDNPIGAGAGEGALCGDVKIGFGLDDVTVEDNGEWVRTITPRVVDLADVSEDTTIEDNYSVTGEFAGNYKITIADGATVVLRDVSINAAGHNYSSTPWAGITCLGNATIILDGENVVKGCYEYWPGIYVPENKTLTITGDGALAAAGSGFYGAGIGGGFGKGAKGGNIVIDGGVITATGGAFGAGIGSAGSNYSMDDTASSCMYITINGGIVTATGGTGAAGIGGGNDSDFWGITINGGSVTAAGGAGAAGIGGGRCYANGGYGDDIIIAGGTVTATGGANAAGIGTGEDGYCISITIGPKITRVVATCGEGCENPIGAGVDGDCENEPDVASSLSDETSVDGKTRVLARQAISGYDAWAEENGLSGAWDATDANGIHNVFRYAFDKPTGEFALIGIEFNESGKAVVVTPPLVNSDGFALSILATDRCDGEGAAATSYPLDPSGKTTIDETVSGSRFFRLKAQEE